MSLSDTLKQTYNNGKGSLQSAGEAFKNFSFKNLKWGSDLPIKPAGRIEKLFLGTAEWTVLKPLKAGLKVVSWGAGVVAKPLAWAAAAPGAFFRAFPTGAPILTVLAGAIGVGSYITHRRSEALQENFANVQAQAMAAQNAQPAYGLAPGEFDQTVAPLMKGADNTPQTGHAGAILAKREAAAAQTATAGQPATSVA